MKRLLAFAAAMAVLSSCSDVRTLSSIRQVEDDRYLYTMDYYADYDLDELVAEDIDSNRKLLEYVVRKLGRGFIDPTSLGCTSFSARNADGGYLFGRNYDMFKNPVLVLRSAPKNAYASISTCDLSHLGLGKDRLPTTLRNKLMTLAAIYAPMDGMNEKGLCVSIMALPKQAACQNTGRHKIGVSILMRLWLDRCATVQEAIDLLATVDVCHDRKAGTGYHFLVSDASGDCAAIEFDLEDNWKTIVIRKDSGKNYMHITNHLLAPRYCTRTPNPKYGNPHSKSWWRYDTVRDFMDARDGILTADQAQECLALVHWENLVWENGMVEDTQWSNVYDQSALTLRLRSWNSYYVTRNFTLFR